MPSILRTPIVRKFHNYTGDVITQGSVTVVSTPSGATATIYSSETGIGTTSQPLALQNDGGVDGWIEIGIYDITAQTSIGTVTSRYYSNHPQQSLLQGTATADNQFQIKDDGDAYSRVSISSGGTISFGSGSAATDVNLYRSGSATVGTDGLVVTQSLVLGGNQTVSGTSFYPDGTSAAPSITFTNSSTTGLWRDTNGLNSTFLVSNRNIERGTAVPTIVAPGTLTAAQFVGKSVNDGGLIFVNLSPAGTITLPTAGSVYSEFGYTGAIFSVTISNIGATVGTVALNTGFAKYTGISFPYPLAVGISITIKNYVLNSGSVILVSATT
jgi:hypothetical protein